MLEVNIFQSIQRNGSSEGKSGKMNPKKVPPLPKFLRECKIPTLLPSLGAVDPVLCGLNGEGNTRWMK